MSDLLLFLSATAFAAALVNFGEICGLVIKLIKGGRDE
jgi:hypothetical protein